MLERRQGSRALRKPPIMQFWAEGGDRFTNPNFAYSQAEKMANETGEPVVVYQNGLKLTTIKPEKVVDISTKT